MSKLNISGIASRTNIAKMCGVLLWLYGCYNTYYAIELFFTVNSGYRTAFAVGAAMLLQAVMTLLEWGIYSGRKPDTLAIVALVFDSLFNATGIYLGVQRIPDTELGVFIKATTPYTFEHWSSATFVVSVVLGVFVAMACERLLQTKQRSAKNV